MKKLLNVLVVALLTGAFPAWAQATGQKSAEGAARISLADARSQIDKVIETPAEMTSVMKRLSAEDQKQFLADVNKAISDMPASSEEKSAKFLNVNTAALRGAADGNVATLIAEVYATVSPEALTVINERFAIDLFSRSSDATATYSDAQFTQIALEVMEKVTERCEQTDNGAPRCAFAIIMILRASNGSPADLSEKLVETLKSDEAKELAKNEWIPSALGQDDRSQSYESILASADAGRRPDYDFVLVIAGPQYGESILHDILGKNNDPLAFMSTRTPVLDAVENPLVHSTPNLGGGVAEQATVRPEAGANIVIAEDGTVVPDPGTKGSTPTPTPTPEPAPYQWQSTR